jgi:hypothetical protein
MHARAPHGPSCTHANRPQQPPQQQARQREQRQAPQPWWCSDPLQLIPPKRRPQPAAGGSLPHADDWRTVRARLVARERSGGLFGAPQQQPRSARPPRPRIPAPHGATSSGAAGSSIPSSGAATVAGFSASLWAHELAAPEVGSGRQASPLASGLVQLPASGGWGGALPNPAAPRPCNTTLTLAAPAPAPYPPQVGCVLVARQQGLDYFDGSVVLIAAHGASGLGPAPPRSALTHACPGVCPAPPT